VDGLELGCWLVGLEGSELNGWERNGWPQLPVDQGLVVGLLNSGFEQGVVGVDGMGGMIRVWWVWSGIGFGLVL
jgi:hypothetical protein